MAEGIKFADGMSVGANKGSTGRADNAVGPDSLSSGGPIDTPCTDKGRSAGLNTGGSAVPTGGPIVSDV